MKTGILQGTKNSVYILPFGQAVIPNKRTAEEVDTDVKRIGRKKAPRRTTRTTRTRRTRRTRRRRRRKTKKKRGQGHEQQLHLHGRQRLGPACAIRARHAQAGRAPVAGGFLRLLRKNRAGSQAQERLALRTDSGPAGPPPGRQGHDLLRFLLASA